MSSKVGYVIAIHIGASPTEEELMQYSGTTALVTGASSGIGAEFARRLAHRGADVVLVSRRETKLHDLATEIGAETGRRAYPVALDLGVDGAGVELRKRLDALGIRVDTIVNSAGVGLTRSFADSSASDIHAQLQLNIISLVDVTHTFLPDVIASGRGALVNVGSLTGFMPVPGMAVYAAAKAFVVRFTEALAHELREAGLTVVVVSPGPTRSEFYTRGGTSAEGVRFQTPEQVVATTLRALDRRRPPLSIVSGASNRFRRRLVPILPLRTLLRIAESRSSV